MTGNNLTLLHDVEYDSTYDQTETLSSLVFFTIVYILVLISGLIGNFIVLFVIFKNNDLKHFTNYFFANLSAADVLVLLFCIPTAIHDVWAKDQWYMGKFFCLINQYIESCATSVSSLTIMAISFERFIAICEPFKVHDIFNETLTLTTILSIWSIGLILSLPFLIFSVYDPLFNPTDSLNNTSNLLTVCHLDANSSIARGCITWFIVILIFIPFFVLIYIYTRIVRELARHRAVRSMKITKNQQQPYDDEINSLSGGLGLNNEQQQSHSFLASKQFEQKRLNTVIICVVTVAFFACQFPVRIIQLIDMYLRVRNEETMPHLVWIWIWKLSKILFFLNFTANPIIYNILSTKFRRSCRRLLQIHHSLSFGADSSRRTSVTSYLYSSIYKHRRNQSNSLTYQQQCSYNTNQKFNGTRPSLDNENRNLVSVFNNDEIFTPTFQIDGLYQWQQTSHRIIDDYYEKKCREIEEKLEEYKEDCQEKLQKIKVQIEPGVSNELNIMTHEQRNVFEIKLNEFEKVIKENMPSSPH
ncbi:unnamed protein product [Rotaria socialis]|uniref:G-protein coupled receptors family 1 profile domain-containing protein n=1 Tax=Rotaria socialis TaxID=392032 RepID=A0A820UV01_9BILA|nr:unnamed protein product [Rotaria socialis]CAF4490981.1 unnamed protein product [Rotaria socialis]CAF4549182.1 unnamed protein product [Rotaria socialis]CAF4805711.1 unnamed protein product [Rotaria socialis]